MKNRIMLIALILSILIALAFPLAGANAVVDPDGDYCQTVPGRRQLMRANVTRRDRRPPSPPPVRKSLPAPPVCLPRQLAKLQMLFWQVLHGVRQNRMADEVDNEIRRATSVKEGLDIRRV